MPKVNEGESNMSPFNRETHTPVSLAILEHLQMKSSHLQSDDKPIESSFLVKELTDYLA